MAVILVMMQLAKKIPFENPEILMLVRGLYVLSNFIILSIYLFTQKKINTKKGTRPFSPYLQLLQDSILVQLTNICSSRHDDPQVRRARSDG